MRIGDHVGVISHCDNGQVQLLTTSDVKRVRNERACRPLEISRLFLASEPVFDPSSAVVLVYYRSPSLPVLVLFLARSLLHVPCTPYRVSFGACPLFVQQGNVYRSDNGWLP